MKLLLITTLLISTTLFAKDKEKMPKYCEHYLIKDDQINLATDQSVFQECGGQGNINITVGELQNSVLNISNKTKEKLATDFQDKLTKEALLSVLTVRNSYQDAYPEFDNHKTERCLSDKYLSAVTRGKKHQEFENLHKKAVELGNPNRKKMSKEAEDTYLNIKIINSLKAQALMNMKKELEKKHKNEWLAAYNKNRGNRREVMGIFPQKNSENILNRDFSTLPSFKDGDTLAKLSKRHEKELQKILTPLHELTKNGYALFDYGGNWNQLFHFKGDKMGPSKFTKTVQEKVKNSDKLIKVFEKSFKSGNDPKGKEYNKLKENLKTALKDKKIRSELKYLHKMKVKELITEFDDGAKQYCNALGEVEGLYSHLNPALANNLFNNLKQKKLNGKEYEDTLMENQAAYCYLLSNHGVPPTNWASKAAIGAAVVAATFLSGPIGGAGTMAALGTGMAVLGTGFAVEGGIHSYQGYQDVQREQALMMAGMSDWGSIADKSKTSNSNMKWTIADAILAPLDLKAFTILKDMDLASGVAKTFAKAKSAGRKMARGTVQLSAIARKSALNVLEQGKSLKKAPEVIKKLFTEIKTDAEAHGLTLAIINKLRPMFKKTKEGNKKFWAAFGKKLRACNLP